MEDKNMEDGREVSVSARTGRVSRLVVLAEVQRD